MKQRNEMIKNNILKIDMFKMPVKVWSGFKLCALSIVLVMGLAACGNESGGSKLQSTNSVQDTINQQIESEQTKDGGTEADVSSENKESTPKTQTIDSSDGTAQTQGEGKTDSSAKTEATDNSTAQTQGVDKTESTNASGTEKKENDQSGASEDKAGGEAAQANASTDKTGENATANTDSDIDIDLTNMSKDMVYSTVYQLLADADSYLGQKIKIKGSYYSAFDETTNNRYYFIIIEDATACCQQGMEFIWDDGSHVFPDEYPEDGTEAEVVGIFETYKDNPEDPYDYVRLSNASFKVCSEEGTEN